MKAKATPRGFVSPVVRVAKTKVLPRGAAGRPSVQAPRPQPFLVHALPLRTRRGGA
jgi:hypothetical protein